MDRSALRLTKRQFLDTMGEKMFDASEKAEFPESIHKERVYAVYDNITGTFRHILLPCDKKNCFTVIIVDLSDGSIYGYYPLDLNEEYGLDK